MNKLSFRCPLCQSCFEQNAQGLVCENRHQFDRSKEGYFNLLPVQNKKSLTPGDTKEQLKARREFLQSGFFDPLKEKILSLLDVSYKSILDLGCGEGYFTRALAVHLSESKIIGIDIAKAGIVMAAKAGKTFSNLTHVVASNFDLPIQDESMDVVLCIFAPSKDSELQRVLKQPNGKLLIVIPGEQHLIELRKKVYPDVRSLQPLPEIEGFVLNESFHVKFDIEMEPMQLQSLLEMTPFNWKINQQIKNQILLGGLNDLADFIIGIYKKC